jgi:hypothetical protein
VLDASPNQVAARRLRYRWEGARHEARSALGTGEPGGADHQGRVVYQRLPTGSKCASSYIRELSAVLGQPTAAGIHSARRPPRCASAIRRGSMAGSGTSRIDWRRSRRRASQPFRPSARVLRTNRKRAFVPRNRARMAARRPRLRTHAQGVPRVLSCPVLTAGGLTPAPSCATTLCVRCSVHDLCESNDSIRALR